MTAVAPWVRQRRRRAAAPHPARRTATRPAPKASSTAKRAARPAVKGQASSAVMSGSVAAIIGLVGVLCVIGLVMVLSASSVQALREGASSWLFFRRQLMWIAAGAVALFVGLRVDYRVWARAWPVILGAVFLMLVAVLVPGVGISANGSTRWLGTGAFRVQPSEFAKLGLALFAADLLSRRGDRVHDPRVTFRPVMAVTMLVMAPILLQPDMGTSIIVAAVVGAVLFVAGIPLSTFARLSPVVVGSALLYGWAAPYRRERMTSFIDPFADASDSGYQVVQSLVGLGSGRLLGVGLGASRAKWGFLPNAHTDFIFAIVGEELGLIGALAVLALFAGFAFLGVRTVCRAPDRFGALLAAGITAWIVTQTFVNIGAVISLLPVTGVPLPFVSFGGSSLIILLFAVGILANIASQSKPPAPTGRRHPAASRA